MRIVMFVAGSLAMASTAQAAERAALSDPNRMICEKQEVLGSRLASKRICKTAAEWQAEKRDNRQSIDRAQIQQNAKQ